MMDLQTENALLRYELEEAAETYRELCNENDALREAVAELEKVLYENGIIYPIIL